MKQKQKPKMKLNVRLLRRIQKHILKDPRRFFMSGLVLKATNQENWTAKSFWFPDLSNTMPPCGTAACIAGWANILTGRPRAGLDRAAKVLGICNKTIPRGDIVDRVFFADKWPEPFSTQWENAKTSRRSARIAVNRIEYLIKFAI